MGIANINSNKRGLLETQAVQFPRLKVSVKRHNSRDKRDWTIYITKDGVP